jgi:hypothetical protein
LKEEYQLAEKDGKRTLPAALNSFVGWLVPGLGYVSQGRIIRGLVLGVVIFVMFAVGVTLGGRLYSLTDRSEGLLSNVFAACDLGTGLLYFLARAAGIAVNDQSELATAEYGNIFLMVSGLLNYLLMLDAFDVAVRRKF